MGKDIHNYQQPFDVLDFVNAARSIPSQVQPSAPKQDERRTHASSKNPLRPKTLKEFIGQEDMKEVLMRDVHAWRRGGIPINHTLFATGPGRGKTTLAYCLAEEMGVRVEMRKCPIDIRTLIELGQTMQDGEILMLDEIHLQAKGKSASNDSAVLYKVMEDGIIETEQGAFNFPSITIIGATTDEGLLPEPLLARFVNRPVFEDYTISELRHIAKNASRKIEIDISDGATKIMAEASQGTPRTINNMIMQARSIMHSFNEKMITDLIAFVVLKNQKIAKDGLTFMQEKYLNALWERKRQKPDGEWLVKASLATMAHAIGRGGDDKFVKNNIEPELIRRGFVDIIPGGRELTPKGMNRIGVSF